MSKLFLISILCVSSLAGAQEVPGVKIAVCIGQYSSMCTNKPDAWFDCQTDIDAVARQACAIHLPDGNVVLPLYRVFEVDFHKGNRCGYGAYNIECYPTTVREKK
jgi:hypothetical protein